MEMVILMRDTIAVESFIFAKSNAVLPSLSLTSADALALLCIKKHLKKKPIVLVRKQQVFLMECWVYYLFYYQWLKLTEIEINLFYFVFLFKLLFSSSLLLCCLSFFFPSLFSLPCYVFIIVYCYFILLCFCYSFFKQTFWMVLLLLLLCVCYVLVIVSMFSLSSLFACVV